MIVDARQLHKRFGKTTVLQDIELQVPEGSVFALIGTNGAGKTTTMRTLVNILQPDSGSVRVLGVDSRSLSHVNFWQIGYLSENQRLPARLNVAQYFDYLRALYPDWDRSLESDLRARLELPADRLLSKLSHGMRMKALLIGAVSFHPKLLILDEPLSGLDSLVRDEVIEGILDLAHESTILISSHELAEIENFTTHVAFMDKGRLLFQQPLEQLQDRFREVHVTLSSQRELPEDLPSSWLNPLVSGHTFRFIDSEFENHDLAYRKLTQHFGAVQVDEEAMSLRDISKALIREARKEVRD